MPDIPRPTPPDPAPPPPRRLGRPQVGLSTVILMVAALAVWLTDAIHRREVATLGRRVVATRPLARELDVADPALAAVVKQEDLWQDDDRWEVYLPEGSYRICLATREVGQHGLAPSAASRPFPAGRHMVALEQDYSKAGGRVVATWDAGGRVEVAEGAGWYPGSGSFGGGEFGTSTQHGVDKPIVLFRRTFIRPSPDGTFTQPDRPSEGVLLWIERAGTP